MKVAVIGAGYVGLVTSACFSERGLEVNCVDKSSEKIESLKSGRIPIFETGLDAMISRNIAANKLRFTSDLATAIKDTEISFIAVGTPGRGDGQPNLEDVYRVAEEIATSAKHEMLIVTKSTVPVGTARKIKHRIQHAAGSKHKQFDIAANPEFLREGSAINDFLKPDRVIIGTETDSAVKKLGMLYGSVDISPVMFTGLETAELIKHSANGFLAVKIAYINQIADICERTGANVIEVSKGLGFDKRIGRNFLDAGPGFGGSCLPKDALALIETAKSAGVSPNIIEAAVEANARRKATLANRVAEILGNVENKKVAVFGLTFKAGTDDVREAPSLELIPALRDLGIEVSAYDPKGLQNARAKVGFARFCENAYQAAEGAHAVIVLTEWPEFRNLDFQKMKKIMRKPIILDFRNLLNRSEVVAVGFEYHGIGIG